MSVPFTPARVKGGKHFPEPDSDGICRRKVWSKKRISRPCGQSVHGDRHVHYPCTIDKSCAVKSWSLEGRANHERDDHR